MNYEDKLNKLTENDFFDLFEKMRAAPRSVNSAGHHSIQLLGLCHHGSGHSVVFDPTTLKLTCHSLCGGGMLLHTYVKRALELDNPQEAKDFIEDWIDGQNIDFDSRISKNIEDFVYKERPFEVKDIEPLPGIGKDVEEKLYSKFDATPETLSRTVWHTKDKIDVELLVKFQVACYLEHGTIILPHHNINGEIVGLYERNFLPLRKDVKAMFPEADYKWLCQFPRAKYLPLLKEGEFIKEDSEKTSWSFSNIRNLYGLHLAKDSILSSKKAIIFEGAKSVMLAHQYGYPYSVASHTFGANENHISMLIKCGAKEIIFAFDKQYENVSDDDKQWKLYEKKTRELAEKIGKFVDVSRIVDYFEDDKKQLLNYKDSPIDNGKEIFEKLFEQREPLIINGESQFNRKRLEIKSDRQKILDKITRPKRERFEEVLVRNKDGKEIITEF